MQHPAHDRRRHVGVGVEESQMAPDGISSALVIRIKLLQGGIESVSQAEVLHTLRIPRSLQQQRAKEYPPNNSIGQNAHPRWFQRNASQRVGVHEGDLCRVARAVTAITSAAAAPAKSPAWRACEPRAAIAAATDAIAG